MNKKFFINLLSKTLITVVLMLLSLILIKSNKSFKTDFYKQVYGTNFSFSKINNLYNKYVGKLDIVDKVATTETVFNEKLIYKKYEKYNDGVCLSVEPNYLVPVQESGIVVFIGKKENYGNVVIIQRLDGIDEWYGNISNTDLKLYDYVKKGELLGEVNNTLYLVYRKNGKSLNYEEYIK